MSEILNIIKSMSGDCECGLHHYTAIKDIQIASGLVNNTGDILRKNEFPSELLLVADENTLKAADGIFESLNGFDVSVKLYKELRVAKMEHVEEIEKLIAGKDIGVLSVGTGSVNDPCRLAAARQNKKYASLQLLRQWMALHHTVHLLFLTASNSAIRQKAPRL